MHPCERLGRQASTLQARVLPAYIWEMVSQPIERLLRSLGHLQHNVKGEVLEKRQRKLGAHSSSYTHLAKRQVYPPQQPGCEPDLRYKILHRKIKICHSHLQLAQALNSWER